MGKPLRLSVGLATANRPAIAAEMLEVIARQTLQPDRIIVSMPQASDLAPECVGMPGLEILLGARGLTRQRNAILGHLGDADIICFFDDDFVPHPGYLAAMVAAFQSDPGLVGATGKVIADGITGAGYSFAEADALLAGSPRVEAVPRPIYNAYGCNMAFRTAPIRANALQFDEHLPRYGWLEDVDFSRQAARFGAIARVGAAMGVHLGVKSGRQSGLCFGYSQIANPLYLIGKGSYAWPHAAWLMGRNIGMNLLRAPWPEPHIDRRGRVVGNIMAIADGLRGRMNPQRIEALS
ncbi:Glycosyltransferase, GT2 family [Bosea sp. OK403]|uniref:glycosyltransferase family 2 protein n=1 Tax=Bosea sp. OK403 TaxID=1855286 RepID=UPI0008E043EE|nr:glycosyltransferase [Bosea sp. OK403]SFJ61818.1 Glycosyltransferase, GT2 family [Bosea sp. OK403]